MSFPPSFFHRAHQPLPDLPRRADKSDHDEPPFHCTWQRCRLCQFSLRESDSIVARVGPERFSAEFTFRLGDTVLVHDPRSYQIDVKPVLLFHSSCLKFKPFTISDDFLAITEHSIRLSELEERQRFKRMQHLLAPKIYDLLSVKLPFELMTMIASYLVRECAMVTSKNQSMFSQASDITVDLSEDVYASYSVLDGVRYVKSLRNIDTDHGREYHRVLNAKQQSAVGKIRICEDHLGIRFVQFLPPASSSSTVPVVKGWWRDILPSKWSEGVSRDKLSTIRVKSDGIKLRNITDTFDEDTRYRKRHISWPNPNYPPNRADLLLYDYVEHFPPTRHVRMTYFDCNAPGVTGYTMVSQGHWVSSIHVHGEGDDAEFYKEADACFSDQVVVYMPVDQGEYVTDIQRRWVERRGGNSYFDLAFATNRGRHTIFGSEKEPLPSVALDTIVRPSQQGSRIYFNKVGPENEPYVRHIAFDEEFEPSVRQFPLRRRTRVIRHLGPPIPDRNPWFASRCDLKGVKEVTVCRDVSMPHKPVIGMLVLYTGGHRDCLGQFRFDKALETIQADRSGGLYIGLQRMQDSTYVADVCSFPPEDTLCPRNVSWINASWSGTLEWKFRRADCAVMHIPAVD